MPAKNKLIGQRFGRLTALKDSGERKHSHVVWECICDCGKKTLVRANSLRAGRTKSCGCYFKEVWKEISKEVNTGNNYGLKHGDTCGGSIPRLYTTWSGMKQRCYNPKASQYKYYGGKGITVCPKWKNNYFAFKIWALGHGYQPKLVIDRINSDGNYAPENCQFISRLENGRKAGKKKEGWRKYGRTKI